MPIKKPLTRSGYFIGELGGIVPFRFLRLRSLRSPAHLVRLSVGVEPAFSRLLILSLMPIKKPLTRSGYFIGELGGIRTRDPLIKSLRGIDKTMTYIKI
jgi:hypothetical protein